MHLTMVFLVCSSCSGRRGGMWMQMQWGVGHSWRLGMGRGSRLFGVVGWCGHATAIPGSGTLEACVLPVGGGFQMHLDTPESLLDHREVLQLLPGQWAL